MTHADPTIDQIWSLFTQLFTCTLTDEWVDDHSLCGEAEIHLESRPGNFPPGEPFRVSCWWIGWEGLAALKYSSICEQANREAISYIIEEVFSHLDDDYPQADITGDGYTIQVGILFNPNPDIQCGIIVAIWYGGNAYRARLDGGELIWVDTPAQLPGLSPLPIDVIKGSIEKWVIGAMKQST